MQLSLSAFPSAPTSPAPGASDVQPTATDAAAPHPVTGKDASFDSLLPKPPSATNPAAGKTSDEAEQAAALLASSLWRPVTPVPPMALPLAGNAGSDTTDSTTSSTAAATMAPLGAAPSSRAFASLVLGLPVRPLPAPAKGEETPVLSPTEDAPTTTSVQVAVENPAPPVSAVFEAVTPSFAFSVPIVGKPAPVSPVKPRSAKSVPAEVTGNGKIMDLPITELPKLAPVRRVGEEPKVSPEMQLSVVEIAPTKESSSLTDQVKITAALSGEEKNAAPLPILMNNSSGQDLSQKKDFLNTGLPVVTAAAPTVGIAVALGSAVMPAVPSNRSKPAANPVAGQVLNIATTAAREFTALAPAIMTVVHDTMAAVVSAVDTLERQVANGPKSVDLQLPVGDQQLGVRVELKDGTVHTTFRTDSAELRTALTHEWQSVVQPGATREVRLADPVFNSSSAGSDNASGSLGQGSPHAREQKAPPAAAFALRPEPADAAVIEPVRSAAHAVTTQLLNAFA